MIKNTKFLKRLEMKITWTVHTVMLPMKRVRGVFVGSGFNSSRTLGVAGWQSTVILFCFGSAASTVKCCNSYHQVKTKFY